MNAHDKKQLKHSLKLKKRFPKSKAFVARPNQGVGADRSVVLGTFDGKKWRQWHKCWGGNHRERAEEFAKIFNSPQTLT